MSIDRQSYSAPLGHFTLGVTAEIFTVVTTQPLDTVKTYTMNKMGFPPITKLWDGCAANCMGAFVQGGIPFLINGMLVQKMSQNSSLTSSGQLLSGMATGLLSSFVIAPFDRVAKLQQSCNLNMASAFQCARVARAGGLFKHIVPIAWRDVLVFGAFFGGRKVMSDRCKEQIPNPRLRENAINVLVGASAGFLSAPMDKISIWMATDTVGKYANMLQTCKEITKEQGRLGLFRGAGTRASFLALYMLALGFAEKSLKPLLVYGNEGN